MNTTEPVADPRGATAADGGRRRLVLGVVAALAVTAGMLALPIRSAAPARPGPRGPLTLASVWPRATVVDLPAALPDGTTYVPVVVLDAATTVGTATSADGTTISLMVVATATATSRTIQTLSLADGSSIDAIAATADSLYWMSGTPDANDIYRSSLWTAARTGGPARRVDADVGEPLFDGSSFDLQPASDGRLYWVATQIGPRTSTEIRSMPLTGGPVTVRKVDGDYVLNAWPWLTTIPGASGEPAQLLNLLTGERHTVAARPDEQLSCSPTWCRATSTPLAPVAEPGTGPSPGANTGHLDLERPDGRDRRRIGGSDDVPVCTVAVLDRFEVIARNLSATETINRMRLTLYDIKHRRNVQIAASATGVGAHGQHMWWSTGDNETLTWHFLDLATLG